MSGSVAQHELMLAAPNNLQVEYWRPEGTELAGWLSKRGTTEVACLRVVGGIVWVQASFAGARVNLQVTISVLGGGAGLY